MATRGNKSVKLRATGSEKAQDTGAVTSEWGDQRWALSPALPVTLTLTQARHRSTVIFTIPRHVSVSVPGTWDWLLDM